MKNYINTDKLIKLYDDLVQFALDDIVARIVQNEAITGAAEFKIWKLQQLGIHLEKIKDYIKKMTKFSDEEIEKIFENAGITLYKPITELFIEQNTNFPLKIESSQYFRDVFSYYLSSTKGTVHNLTRTTAISSQNLLINKLDQVHFRVVSGIQNYSQAISEAIDEIGKSSLKVVYPSGHQDSVDVAVRRAVVTGVNKCFSDLNLIRAKQNGYSHVLVSSHLGARHVENPSPEYLSHDIWQGKVYEVDWDTVPFVKIHNK